MIYGINFNGSQIPASVGSNFAARLKNRQGKLVAVGNDRSCDLMLKGVCNSEAEKDAMLVVANNGHRQLHVVQRGGWFGIYTS